MASCSNGNPLANAITGLLHLATDPVGGVINLIAKSILAAAIAVFAGLADSVPTLQDTTTSHDISNKTSWIVVYLAVGSLLFAAGKMALERKGTAGITALKGILRVVLVSGAATTICLAAATVADDYSKHLFNNSVRNALDNIGACGDNSHIQPFLLLILAFLLLLAGILHTILMYIRLGIMMILLGTLPMAAAASMTDWGAGWWRKHIGWMIAWLLYKPAVALVLNAGMTMITQGKTHANANVNTRIAGIGVMLLSAIALPALLKLVVPAAAAMGTGNPMASMGQAGNQLASGAVQVGAMSGGFGGGGGGQKGPSGANGTGSAGGGGADGTPGGGGADGASGSGGPSGPSGGTTGGGDAAKAAGGAGRQAAAAMGGPAGIALLAAGAAAQVASSTVSGAVEGADGELGNNK
ncbi:hypothetical protein ABZT03_37745 [Streptomyces sp. NPDC005574]|uniref:hypothetical protein n=1 Tax=Streptomyces sp. NPDC005574 TaxID=3156891 RepID=UPI0033B5D69A